MSIDSFIDFPAPCSNASEWRPFALKILNEKMYFGGVCSGEAGSGELLGLVYEMDLNGNGLVEVLNFDLAYYRADLNPNGFPCGIWQPWLDEFLINPVPGISSPGLISTFATINTALCHTQPMLTDIDFTADGDMLVFFTDRFGHQMGGWNYGPDPTETSTTIYETLAGGDLVRADFNGSTYTPQWLNTVNVPPIEYYTGDNYSTIHPETVMGSGANLYCLDKVMSVALDPVVIYSGGFLEFNADGTSGKRATIYQTPLFGQETFGKASGLGEITLMSNPAPIEIGNRVWFDINKNGEQDAGETGLEGISVELYLNDVLIASTITNTMGEYYFNDANVPGGLMVNTE
ncbi:hypothetical protein PEDI_32930 [Persicobacter diffluens]|uniref:SD-repeat containing protein B domain-containing protein n=2 Tax=Persicobacter diffluens TaxID=981 RepID=A0AAN5AMV0_9BACT|nr:hypothetical protein PEDI_32930 [Persicobacter diffluens]